MIKSIDTDIWSNNEKYIIDINYNIFEIMCPLYLSINFPIKNDHNIFCSVGTGIPISFGKTSYKIKEEVEFDNPDYNSKESWPYEWSNPMYSYSFGYLNNSWFFEIEVTQDYEYKKLGRIISNPQAPSVYVDNKLTIVQLILGYQLR